MPRAVSPETESEAERIPSKKQKKREKSPVPVPIDEPMDEDGAEEEDEGEYEIEKVLESSNDVFKVCAVCFSWPRRSGLNILPGRDCLLREMERLW